MQIRNNEHLFRVLIKMDILIEFVRRANVKTPNNTIRLWLLLTHGIKVEGKVIGTTRKVLCLPLSTAAGNGKCTKLSGKKQDRTGINNSSKTRIKPRSYLVAGRAWKTQSFLSKGGLIK